MSRSCDLGVPDVSLKGGGGFKVPASLKIAYDGSKIDLSTGVNVSLNGLGMGVPVDINLG